MKINSKWVRTDTHQYGRQISFCKFEFKEKRNNETYRDVINLSDYNESDIENFILPYGYTLEGINIPSYPNIYNMYGKQALWIIAECIFEQES